MHFRSSTYPWAGYRCDLVNRTLPDGRAETHASFSLVRLANGVALVRLGATTSDRLRILAGLGRYACAKALRRRSAVMTLPFAGLELTLDWGRAEHVPLREILVRSEYWLTPDWQPAMGQTIVDVGANAGVFAVVAAREVGDRGRVVAVEPNPDVYERLARNVGRNGLANRVDLIRAATGERPASAHLVGAIRNTTIAHIVADGIQGAAAGYQVEVARLDDLLGDVAIDHIDFMKVDVEGSEVVTLLGAGATLARTSRLVVEATPDTIGEVTTIAERAGFDRLERRQAGPDSGATILYAARSLGR